MRALILAAGSVVCAGVLAQSPSAPTSPAAAVTTRSAPTLNTPDTRPAAPEWTLDDFTARSLERLAVVDLRLSPEPAPRDYKIAASLLALASKLRPEDADLVRRRIESEWNAGDETEALNATQRLLKLDPADTVAQLRYVSAMIARLQTAEARIAAYERFLGPEGKSLDASIRSRLALDAALMYRERNNEDKFAEKLKQATALDPTNKDAALMAKSYYVGAIDDPVGRIELMSNLLYSDPLDPRIYMDMASELASGGAFTGASRMFRIGESILTAAGTQLSGIQQMHRLILAWQVAGPKSVREQLEKTLNTERHTARQIADRQKIMNVPGEEIVDPQAIRLPRAAEQVRALACFAEGNEKSLETSMNDLAQTVAKMAEEALDDEKRPKELTKEVAVGVVRDAVVDLALLRAFFGVQLDKVDPALENLAPPPPETDHTPDVVRAIMKENGGDHAGALADLTRLGMSEIALDASVPEFQMYAEVARGKVFAAMGRSAEAAACYRTVVKHAPLTPQGALAASMLEKLTGKREAIFGRTAELERLAAGIPRWIEDIVSQPRNFVGVTADVVSTTQDPLSPMLVKISVRNLGAVPMGLGSNRPINSRFLFAPNIDLKSLDARRFARPEIIDLDRRLRLMPGETVEALVWADPGFAGWFSECISAQVIRAKYRIVQGFVTSQHGVLDPGPGCIQTDLPIVVRTTLREATLGTPDFAAEAANAKESSVVRLAAAARALVLGEDFNSRKLSTVDRATIAQALARRYPTLSPTGRAALAATVPHARQAPEFIEFDQVALQETDPSVLPVVLLTRPGSADDPALKAALDSSDERVKLVATLQSERLESKAPCFAMLGPYIDQASDWSVGVQMNQAAGRTPPTAPATKKAEKPADKPAESAPPAKPPEKGGK